MAVETYSGPNKHQFLVDLARANRFVAKDLETNRSGRIAEKQMLRLTVRALRPLWIAGAVFAGWMLMVILIQMYLPSLARKIFFEQVGLAGIGTLFGMIVSLIVVALLTTRNTFLLLLDCASGSVEERVGRVAPTFEEIGAQGLARFRGETKAVYYYCVKDQNYEVSAPAHELLTGKYDTYRPFVKAYFTPRSRLLLSVEPVEGSPEAAPGGEEAKKWVFEPVMPTEKVEPTYYATRRNFDLIPSQWAPPASAAPAPEKEPDPGPNVQMPPRRPGLQRPGRPSIRR